MTIVTSVGLGLGPVGSLSTDKPTAFCAMCLTSSDMADSWLAAKTKGPNTTDSTIIDSIDSRF